MGHILTDIINAMDGSSIVALVSPDWSEDKEEKKYTSIESFSGNADCVIDFSNHTATASLLEWCKKNSMPVVIATTGHTPDEQQMIFAAAKESAEILGNSFDIEIIEKHHNKKLDVPSGTALLLADEIKEARPDAEYEIGRHDYGQRTKNEIGIHSIRLGNEVGTHEIIISTGNETLTIKHESENRALFADGAIAAAEFLNGKPNGLYSMKDILKAR